MLVPTLNFLSLLPRYDWDSRPTGHAWKHLAPARLQQISIELAAMARRSRLELLAYLLEMVRLEAGARAGVSGRASGHDRH